MAAPDSITLLWQAVDHWAEKRPDAEALVFQERRITWREFRDQVDRVAMAFLEIGVERGDRIAMVAMGCPEFMITFMAAAKVGAIWLGISPKFTPDEIRYILGHCQPTVLLTLHEYAGIDLVERGLTFGQEFPSIREVLVIGNGVADLSIDYQQFVDKPRPHLEAQLKARAAEVHPNDEALLMYTSGSTGKPKGVLQTHHSIIQNIAAEVRYFGFDEDTRALLHFPINHVAADVEIGYGAVYGGGTLVFADRFDPVESLDLIDAEGITVVGQVPVMFLMQFQVPKFRAMDWSRVKAFIWGGSGASPILLQVLSGIAAQTGARLITGYGSTEICGFATYTMPEDNLERLAKSAGKIVPPFEMKIVDDARKELPHGEIGEIAIRGPILMKGYLNNPSATAAVFDDDGWYYTSDQGYMDAEGYLYISGRKSEMYKSGGENVFPREIEDVLEGHPAVLFAAVIGVPDTLYQEVGHAFVMLKPGQTTTPDDLRAYCKERLANFKVPKAFDLQPQLPLLPNGKVNKMALRKELPNA
jgi:acyl-CoA synthetase (AMP-forming)/AMP-acid ligase II